LSDIVDTTTSTATDTPAQPIEPPEAPPTAAPPTGNGHRPAGWFSGGWRYGLAAAIVVVVAGAFFTIGWFTSTRADHGHGAGGREICQQMNQRGWGFRQGETGQRGSNHGQRQPYDEGQSGSNGQPTPQTPSTTEAPSTPQTPAGPQNPYGQQGYLGVVVATVTPELQQQYGLSRADGALVASVDGTGPARQAGIQRGDIITSIDGTPVTTQQDVVNVVAGKSAGDSVSVVVDRDGQSLTFQVTLAARQDIISG
jgi:membrane-associated protease RseP (regulator of RpoE activity)